MLALEKSFKKMKISIFCSLFFTIFFFATTIKYGKPPTEFSPKYQERKKFFSDLLQKKNTFEKSCWKKLFFVDLQK